ncbi:MAG: hypothetical protein WB791_06920 [Waddliaceae bacterium]
MSINATCQSLEQMLPSRDWIIAKSAGFFANAVRNVNQAAIPAIALLALSSLPGASAGGSEYLECWADCAQMNQDNGLWQVVCPVICAPYLFARGG